MSVDRAHRLWRSARLQVPRKRPSRRIASTPPRPTPPTGPNRVWAYDYVFAGQRGKRESDGSSNEEQRA